MSGYDDDFARLDNEAARMGGEEVEPIAAAEQRRKAGADDEDCSYNSLGEDLQLDESI